MPAEKDAGDTPDSGGKESSPVPPPAPPLASGDLASRRIREEEGKYRSASRASLSDNGGRVTRGPRVKESRNRLALLFLFSPERRRLAAGPPGIGHHRA